MFITEREIQTQTGVTVTRASVNLAQMMIETYAGKVEEEIVNGVDRTLMSQAVMFQAVYMEERPLDVMTQAAVLSKTQGENSTKFNSDMFSPFLSPWSIKALSGLSWKKSRSIKTGKVHQSSGRGDSFYNWTHDIGIDA